MIAGNITTWKKKKTAHAYFGRPYFSKSFGGKIQPFSNRCCREVNIKQPEHAWYKYPFLSFSAGKQNVLTSRLLVNSFNEKTNQMLVSIKSKKYIHEYAWLKWVKNQLWSKIFVLHFPSTSVSSVLFTWATILPLAFFLIRIFKTLKGRYRPTRKYKMED